MNNRDYVDNTGASLQIVDTIYGVTLVGGAEFQPDVLSQALDHAPIVVAADGGAARAVQYDLELAAVIGDLDSLDAATRATLPQGKVHFIPDQETTDFDKCLARITAPIILAVGFTGARLDHQLAVFSTLVQWASQPCVVMGPDDVAFVAPLSLKLQLPVGTRLSLYPMAPVTGTSRGLRWPIKGITFAPDSRIGTSNEAASPEVSLRFSDRRMLVILPRDCLAEAIRSVAPEFVATTVARGE